MNGIGKVVKLDLISIKPYFTFKNLLILLLLSVLFYFTSSNPLMVISMPLLFSMLYSSYPFMVGEESGLDALYRIFGIQPKDVVLGRYFSSIFLFILSSVLALLIYFGFFIVGQAGSLENLLITYWIYFILYSLIVSFQYPFYFKLGYKRAKIVAIFGMFLFGAIAGAILSNMSESMRGLLTNSTLTVVISLSIVLVILAVSIFISNILYKNKDF